MAIYKSKQASNYTVLPNDVFHSDLSLGAIGLLAYFLSLPPDWVIYKTTLHTKLNIGRDKLDKYFNELRNKGFVVSVKKIDKGKISYEHIVYDKPFNGEPQQPKPITAQPSTGKPLTEKPLTVELPLLSTNTINTNILNKKEEIERLFDVFWNMYDRKVGKDKAFKKWMTLTKEEIDKILAHVPKYVLSTPDANFRKHPTTYLSNKGWLDEIIEKKPNTPQQQPKQPELPIYRRLDV